MKSKIRRTLLRLGYYTKPDFIIVGAQKAGTTGLFKILEKHTSIISPKLKEIHYFDNDAWYNQNKLFQYHSFFPLPHTIKKNSKLFEASPEYIIHPEVAFRLHKYNPNLKLILLLREPAQRAFSAWTMYHHHFKTGRNTDLHDPRPFSTAISEELNNFKNESFHDNIRSYINRGIYHLQIENYLNYFKKDQLLILEAKSLRKNTDQVLKKVFDFIEVPYEKIEIVTANSSKINEKDRYEKDIKELQKFYQPYNNKLFDLIDEKFDWNTSN